MEYRPIDRLAKEAEGFVRARFDDDAPGIGTWPPIRFGGENAGPAPLYYLKEELLTTRRWADDVRELLVRLDDDCPPDPDGDDGGAYANELREGLPGQNHDPEGVVAIRVGGDPLALARSIKALARSDAEVPDELVVGPHFVLRLAPSPHVGPGSDPRPAEGDAADGDTGAAHREDFATRIAVIDTGIWQEPPHRLRNVVAGSSDREDVDTNDNGIVDHYYTGHGGFVAGVIERGAPDVGIVVKNAFRNSVLTEASIIQKVAETAKDGVVVLNLSLGSYQDDELHSGPGKVDMVALTAAMHEWKKRDLLIVAAAGNDHRDDPWYPAGFAADPDFEDMVVSVGALEAVPGPGGHPLWRPADFSNYGPWVTAWAPGVDIESEYPRGLKFRYSDGSEQTFTGGRAYWDGTSFATPYVAAAIIQHAREMGNGASPLEAWADLRSDGDDEDLRPFVLFGTHETHLVAAPVSHKKPVGTKKLRRHFPI